MTVQYEDAYKPQTTRMKHTVVKDVRSRRPVETYQQLDRQREFFFRVGAFSLEYTVNM
jgi:hypothetical protein